MKALSISIVVFLTTFQSNSQDWQPDPESRSTYLQTLFFNDFDDVLKVNDSWLVFTKHAIDHYWKKKNADKGRILINALDEKGNIHVVGQINNFAMRSVKRTFNHKYYFLSRDPKRLKGNNYYDFLVLNSAWEIERSFSIPEIADHQRGYEDFVVDKDENIYLVSSPYFLDHNPDDFKGSYLVKIDSFGQYLNKNLFAKSFLNKLSLNNGLLSIIANKQLWVDNFFITDSIETVRLNSSLETIEYAVSRSSNLPKGYRSILKLKNGYDVVSIYAMETLDGMEHYDNRIAMLDKTGSPRWVYDFPSHYILNDKNAKELENGTFLLEVEKKGWRTQSIYDTISVIQFDSNGKHKEIRQYLDGAKSTMVRPFVSSFFETTNNEIWLFNRRSYPDLQERIYFEKLHLSN